MLGIIVLPLSTMVPCKETRAVIVALHKKGFTGKDIAASKIAPKSTIYRKKKCSGRPRKSSKQGGLIKLIQLGAPPVQSLLRNGSRQV